jgi:hypothetical protein
MGEGFKVGSLSLKVEILNEKFAVNKRLAQNSNNPTFASLRLCVFARNNTRNSKLHIPNSNYPRFQ